MINGFLALAKAALRMSAKSHSFRRKDHKTLKLLVTLRFRDRGASEAVVKRDLGMPEAFRWRRGGYAGAKV